MSDDRTHVILLFGATGDLAKRKLIPGLFHLAVAGLLPDFRVVGAGRSALSVEEFRQLAREACEEFAGEDLESGRLDEYVNSLRYVELDDDPAPLREIVAEAAADLDGESGLLIYMSVPPSAAPSIIDLVDRAGLAEGARLVAEKPFGTDLASARELNGMIHEVFDEEQVFRIDHFLGKEAAQNILALRFANGLFEPIWNRMHISHVQIDVPETLGVEERAGFYEGTGAFRDMVVTHLLQVLAFVAMEPPTELSPEAISIEKDKVFRSLKPIDPSDVVRGQYEGYRDNEGVAEDSDTETLVALRCNIDNWRWSGVPFYLRTGKRMAEGARIISIAFREPPKSMFPEGSGMGEKGPDHLTFDLDDASRLSLSYYGKRAGAGMKLEKLSMQFSVTETEGARDILEAYERLIIDAIRGDQTLFTTATGIERLWEVSAPLLENPPPAILYRRNSWGPEQVHDVIAPKRWRLPFERRWRESPGASSTLTMPR